MSTSVSTKPTELYAKVFHHLAPTKRAKRTGFYFVVFEVQPFGALPLEVYQSECWQTEKGATAASERVLAGLRAKQAQRIAEKQEVLK